MSDNQSMAIIFVLYQSYDAMLGFLEQQETDLPGTRLIVVDNTPYAQQDADKQALIAKHRAVTLVIPRPENPGYAGAAHDAMIQLPELADFDFVAISNTDLKFNVARMQNALAQMAEPMDQIGAIAPRLIAADGARAPQLHYARAPSRAKYARLAWVYSCYPLTVAHRLAGDLKRKLGLGRAPYDLPQQIFAPHGALMILTRAYFAKTKGFAHPAFLFCEEVFIGAECRDAGLKVIYAPSLTYAHDNHGAMGAIPSRRIMGYLRDAHRAVLPRLR